MIRKKITIDLTADSLADIATIEKALNVYVKEFTAKEHDKLRMIILYEPATTAMLRQRLQS
jgi:hypothetical protein